MGKNSQLEETAKHPFSLMSLCLAKSPVFCFWGRVRERQNVSNQLFLRFLQLKGPPCQDGIFGIVGPELHYHGCNPCKPVVSFAQEFENWSELLSLLLKVESLIFYISKELLQASFKCGRCGIYHIAPSFLDAAILVIKYCLTNSRMLCLQRF